MRSGRVSERTFPRHWERMVAALCSERRASSIVPLRRVETVRGGERGVHRHDRIHEREEEECTSSSRAGRHRWRYRSWTRVSCVRCANAVCHVVLEYTFFHIFFSRRFLPFWISAFFLPTHVYDRVVRADARPAMSTRYVTFNIWVLPHRRVKTREITGKFRKYVCKY